MAGYQNDKEALMKRMVRIEGQVRGVARMIETDRYCIDVLDQVSAINRALEQVALGLVRDHLGHCVADAVKNSADGGQAKLDEAVTAIGRMVKV